MNSSPIAEGWANAETAAGIVGYTVEHVRRLAHQGRIEARKIGRDWLVNLSNLSSYKAKMDRLGTGKHNPTAPWRDEA